MSKNMDNVKNAAASEPKANRGTRSTLSLSMADKEKLLRMVEEEAKKIFKNGNVPIVQQDTIKNAVKRTLDASLLEDD